MNNTILAIDLGKYKSVACVLDQNTGEFRVTTLPRMPYSRSAPSTNAQARRKGKQWLLGAAPVGTAT